MLTVLVPVMNVRKMAMGMDQLRMLVGVAVACCRVFTGVIVKVMLVGVMMGMLVNHQLVYVGVVMFFSQQQGSANPHQDQCSPK